MSTHEKNQPKDLIRTTQLLNKITEESPHASLNALMSSDTKNRSGIASNHSERSLNASLRSLHQGRLGIRERPNSTESLGLNASIRSLKTRPLAVSQGNRPNSTDSLSVSVRSLRARGGLNASIRTSNQSVDSYALKAKAHLRTSASATSRASTSDMTDSLMASVMTRERRAKKAEAKRKKVSEDEIETYMTTIFTSLPYSNHDKTTTFNRGCLKDGTKGFTQLPPLVQSKYLAYEVPDRKVQRRVALSTMRIRASEKEKRVKVKRDQAEKERIRHANEMYAAAGPRKAGHRLAHMSYVTDKAMVRSFKMSFMSMGTTVRLTRAMVTYTI